MRMHILNHSDLAWSATKLCRQHLIGDHGELHKHLHVFIRKYSIAGRRGQISPLYMKSWHNALAAEMTNRGYNHKSKFQQPNLTYLPYEDLVGKANEEEVLEKLQNCPECRKRL